MNNAPTADPCTAAPTFALWTRGNHTEPWELYGEGYNRREARQAESDAEYDCKRSSGTIETTIRKDTDGPPPKPRVIISVIGGVASIAQCPDWIDVVIHDYDNCTQCDPDVENDCPDCCPEPD